MLVCIYIWITLGPSWTYLSEHVGHYHQLPTDLWFRINLKCSEASYVTLVAQLCRPRRTWEKVGRIDCTLHCQGGLV